ncbi:MAG: hypothetical protein EBU66_13635 [Bacteroidetes bacterium]|nr:hypothetical protein [bacterium]NBP65688.1 hypothetical protein [Bacteroidota bacterium]
MPPALHSFWKDPLLDMAKHVWAVKKEEWIDDSPRLEDTAMLKRYAELDSAIDEVNFREDMMTKWKNEESGVVLKVRELPGRTRVLFLGTEEQWSQIPWSTWARIFQAIDHPIGYTLLYADPRPRVDPTSKARELKAQDINGGFSYICHQEVVVIYRFEEATRVLLHELLHTACFDKEKSVEDLEVHTEAWTEIFLCALLSKGSSTKFNTLWRKQVAWMTEQANSLRVERNVHGPRDYAWRYMTGKMALLNTMGFLRGYMNMATVPTISLRFTTPEWDEEMVR